LTTSATSCLNRNFSHIYVERGARDYPDTDAVLARFPRAVIVDVENYQHVFARRGQDFQSQKRSMKLILAVKKDQFIYDGSPYAPDFGHEHFFYNAQTLNCVYNCDYCYLQGMYLSGNIVLFVNGTPFFEAAEAVLQKRGGLYLAVSYDTDLLAFENILPVSRRWIEWGESRTGAMIELRTKSTNFAAISDMPPPQNTILAWTLSPSDIAEKHEKKAPPFRLRLASMKAAVEAGWKVRLCVDPMLYTADWREQYTGMVDAIGEAIDMTRLHDAYVGVFRMNSDYLQRMQKMRKDSAALFYPFVSEGREATYAADLAEEMKSTVRDALCKRMPADRVFCH
jgi:spore photoproduct lyase